MFKQFSALSRGIRIYFIITALTGLALGLSDAVLANYFKEVYQVDALQRGFIEFPRELPGMLCMFVIMMLSSMGDIKSAVVAQVFSAVGLLVLGFFTPSFNVMLIFLFIYSMGMHTYMPLGDSIGLSLSEGENMGRRIGQFNGVKTGFSMVAGIITFLGFKTGFFSFKNPIVVFLLSAVLFVAVGALLVSLLRDAPKAKPSAAGKMKIVVRREYINYYLMSMLFGGRKQIMFVYSPWVLIELLDFKTDTMAMLSVIGSFIGIFFMPVVGKWIDRYGVRKIMMVEAFAFILIYVAYGYISAGLTSKVLAVSSLAVGLAFLLNIIDRMTAQFAMVRSIYMRSIAITPEDITPSLSLGLSVDHVVAIGGSAVCGWIWYQFGPQYVFVVAGFLSFLNLLVIRRIKTR